MHPLTPTLPEECPDRKIRNDITAEYHVTEDGIGRLRLDDKRRLDFWLELDFDIPTLEKMLAEVKARQNVTT